MAHRNNVLARIPRPTTKSYRDAVKKIVLAIQAEEGLNDAELAERVGCSAGTIKNARNEATNLDGVTLANLEYEFGPAAIDAFLALGGSRAVPLHAELATADAPTSLAQALHLILKTQEPTSPGGRATLPCEVTPILSELIDARTALDALIAMASEEGGTVHRLRAET